MRRTTGWITAVGLTLALPLPASASVWLLDQKARLAPTSARYDGYGTGVAGLPGTVFVGSPDESGGELRGAVHVYDLANGVWAFKQRLVPLEASTTRRFGQVLSADGIRLAVGAPGPDGVGAVFVFRLQNGAWIQEQRLLPPSPEEGAEFGASISLWEDRLIVGSPRADVAGQVDRGRAYVYERAGTQWTLAGELSPPDPAAGMRFGVVALWGDVAVVGAPRGARASIFVRGASWAWVQDLRAGATAPAFGMAVAVYQGRIAVAGARDDPRGYGEGPSVRIYDPVTAVPPVWSLHSKAIPNDLVVPQELRDGTSLALTTNDLYVGVPYRRDSHDFGQRPEKGAVYRFDPDSGYQYQQILPIQPQGWARTGWSIALAGTAMIAGAPGGDGSELNSGAAFVFDVTPASSVTPVLTGLRIDSIAPTSVVASVELVDGAPLSTQGMFWGRAKVVPGITYGDPGLTRTSRPDGDLGRFSFEPFGLEPSTDYLLRAYATNLGGTVYSDAVAFRTACAEIRLPDLDKPVLGVTYDGSVRPEEGRGGMTFTVSSGALPPGLSLQTTGLGSGRLTGAPTTLGDAYFTVSVVDGLGCRGQRPYVLRTVATGYSVEGMTIREGNAGSSVARFLVRRLGDLGTPGRVRVAASERDPPVPTATAGSDFGTTHTVLTFLQGESVKWFEVLVHGDTYLEGNERFDAILYDASEGEIAHAAGQGWIVDDDGAGIRVSDARIADGPLGRNSVLRFVITGPPAPSYLYQVRYRTVEGTASAASDYEDVWGEVILGPTDFSAVVEVPVLGDGVVEGEESLTLEISCRLGPVTDATGVGTIVDDGPSIVSFAASQVLVAPGGASTLSWLTEPGVSLTLNGSPVTGPSGTLVVHPSVTTSYVITATSSLGTASSSVTVVVGDGGAPLGVPLVVTPLAGETLGVKGVSFAWTSVAGAASYDLRIFAAQGGATVFSGFVVGAYATSTLLTLPAGSYQFAVRACAGGFDAAHCGNFGAQAFSVEPIAPSGTPSIVAPTQGAGLLTSTQTFSWTPVLPDPRLPDLYYEVLLKNVTTGAITLQVTVPAPETSTIFTMGSSTQYELKVRACQAGCGPWSSPRTFSVALPAVPTAAPVIGQCQPGVATVTCNWTAVPNADTYRIQVVQPSGGPGGSALTVAAIEVSSTSATLTAPIGVATVLISACNGDGCGPSAQAPIFLQNSPDAPHIGTPMAGTVVQGPLVLFTWSRVPSDGGAGSRYRLYVQDLSRQAPAVDVYTEQNYYAAYLRAEGARYDAVVIEGWSRANAGPAASFIVAGASATAPTMVAPTHDSLIQGAEVQLGWTPVPGATLYEYFVAVLGQPNATVRGVTPGLVAHVPLGGARGSYTLYSAIVRACPAGATCAPGTDAGWGPWSNVGGPGVTNFTVYVP